MHEIKFRGKVAYNENHKFNGEWIYGYYRNNENGNAFITETLDEMDNYIFDETEIDGNTIGQYTGLKDKNGKEIYEGDIVEIGVDRAIIKYDDEFSGFILKPIGEYYFDSPMLAHNLHIIDAIMGNIYDNPELLKEE